MRIREPSVAVIVPVLNEEKTIEALLAHLSSSQYKELIVVDGGSRDATCELVRVAIAKGSHVRLLQCATGRACQMNAGARMAASDALLFLHADTRLPEDAILTVQRCLRRGDVWGRFDVRLDHPGVWYRLIEAAMNLRSRITGIVTGDQALFVRRDAFEVVGGYPDIPLMEDIVLSKRLKEIGQPAMISQKAITSARRWQQNGILVTILTMWVLRLLFWAGVSPGKLIIFYNAVR